MAERNKKKTCITGKSNKQMSMTCNSSNAKIVNFIFWSSGLFRQHNRMDLIDRVVCLLHNCVPQGSPTNKCQWLVIAVMQKIVNFIFWSSGLFRQHNRMDLIDRVVCLLHNCVPIFGNLEGCLIFWYRYRSVYIPIFGNLEGCLIFWYRSVSKNQTSF